MVDPVNLEVMRKRRIKLIFTNGRARITDDHVITKSYDGSRMGRQYSFSCTCGWQATWVGHKPAREHAIEVLDGTWSPPLSPKRPAVSQNIFDTTREALDREEGI